MMESKQVLNAEYSNKSASDDDSSVEKDSNFSIGKIQKMIDQKMQPRDEEKISEEEKEIAEELEKENSAGNNDVTKSLEIHDSTLFESSHNNTKMNDFTKTFDQD